MKKLLILGFLLLVGCGVKNVTNNQPTEQEYVVKLVAVGDNLIHSNVYEAAAISDSSYDFTPMFTEIKPYIKSFDLAFINQETILGGKEIGLTSYPCFNSPYEVGDAVIDAGFNLISIANNHTLDRGEKAVINALDYWDSKDVIYSGAARSADISQVKTFNKKGISFAFVAYTYGTNGIPHPQGKEYLANIYSNEKAYYDITSVRDEVDVVIVSMHWGNEYEEEPSQTQIAQANYLSSLGVDIIIGHHPHVIQPVDVINDTYVIYSLGNFLSGQIGVDRLIGMAFSVDIIKRVEGDNKVITIVNPQAKLLHHYRDQNKDFHIKFFTELNNEILYDYLNYYESKSNLVKKYYQDIIVT